jgi:hypothetical protein
LYNATHASKHRYQAHPPHGLSLYAMWLFLTGNFGEWGYTELRRTPSRRSSQNAPSTHSGEYLVRGLSVQHHQRPPGEEVGDVTVGMLVANIVAVGHARVS